MANQSYFEKRFQKFSQSRAGGLIELKLMARLETVAEELNGTLCIDGGPPAYLEAKLKSSWDNFLTQLEDVHNAV